MLVRKLYNFPMLSMSFCDRRIFISVRSEAEFYSHRRRLVTLQ